MNDIAQEYVRLVLAVGQHDADYVDAYYGPPEWRTEVEADPPELSAIAARADELLADLGALPVPDADLEALRRRYLTRQLESLRARVGMLQGDQLSFDDESRVLYDAVAPATPVAQLEQVLASLDSTLPGSGSVQQRYSRYRERFIVPPALVDTVFARAIAECRDRTAQHLALPREERFTVEYVTDKSWSGYNWYQGQGTSLIQVNTDLPIYVDRAIDLACHEGYPGHHVYNALLEEHLVRGRGWVEYTVYPLFSPQSLIAEGSANYGIEIAFPAEERVAFEQAVLFPLAGLDPTDAVDYYRIQSLVDQLSYAGNEAARHYLNQHMTAGDAADWLERFALMTPERARQRVRFIEQYRSYVINYNLGKDLVAAYVERRAGDDHAQRWAVFGELLSSPRLPSDLVR